MATTQFFFGGADPAPAQSARADDGAMACLRARPRGSLEERDPEAGLQPTDFQLDFVNARRVRGASVDQWSGMFHLWQLRYAISGWVLDNGGGGQWLKPKLAERRQLIENVERECVPILTRNDKFAVVGLHNLSMFKRGDPGIDLLWTGLGDEGVLVDVAHGEFTTAVDRSWVRFAVGVPDREKWPREKVEASRCLKAGVSQLQNVSALVNDEGEYLTTARGARQFTSLGKKDIAYAMLYAYIAFLIWLKSPEFALDADGGEVAFAGW
jgi:hypothetical protein